MIEDEFQTFPDGPRVELDRMLAELVDRARDVLETQDRLRALVRANQVVAEQLDLPILLRRIVDVAVELVGAQYAALGVISPCGTLEQFIHAGMSAASSQDADEIDSFPEGRALLSILIEDPRPMRLDNLSTDPRFADFPSGRPTMDSFLGVPIRVRDEVYGHLYLTNQSYGTFSADDEQLITSLAATAGFAIDNARLFAETRRRQAWAAASAEITATLLADSDDDSIGILADCVLSLSGADFLCLVYPTDDPGRLLVGTVRGVSASSLEGATIPSTSSIAGLVLESKQPSLNNDPDTEVMFGDEAMVGPVMAVPLITSGRVQGALVIGRHKGKSRFLASDLEMTADFAGQASVAMELARVRADRQRMILLEDRGRIARDLHDHVIQQLFATGLELQSVGTVLPPGIVADRIGHAISNLDDSISHIRAAVFAVSAPTHDRPKLLRHRLIDTVNEMASSLARTPSLSFSGPIDLMVTKELADDVIAVVREALANVVKYASADQTSVTVTVANSSVLVEVTDDGKGIVPNGTGNGLTNMKARAVQRGGTFSADSDGGKTRIRWHAPVEAHDNTSRSQGPSASNSRAGEPPSGESPADPAHIDNPRKRAETNGSATHQADAHETRPQASTMNSDTLHTFANEITVTDQQITEELADFFKDHRINARKLITDDGQSAG